MAGENEHLQSFAARLEQGEDSCETGGIGRDQNIVKDRKLRFKAAEVFCEGESGREVDLFELAARELVEGDGLGVSGWGQTGRSEFRGELDFAESGPGDGGDEGGSLTCYGTGDAAHHLGAALAEGVAKQEGGPGFIADFGEAPLDFAGLFFGVSQ